MLGQLAVLTMVLAVAQTTAAASNPCDADLGAWLQCNNPKAIRYLSRLTADDVGTALAGVKLSDGSFRAKGYRLLGLPTGLGRGVHVILVRRAKPSKSPEVAGDEFAPGGEGAFVWVEPGGVPLPLPTCGGPAYESAYVLSGDVYTWKAVQPDHGVVEVGCVDPAWTRKVQKRASGPTKS